MPEHPEPVAAFMKRMWDQDMRTIAEADYSRLLELAMLGAKSEDDRLRSANNVEAMLE